MNEITSLLPPQGDAADGSFEAEAGALLAALARHDESTLSHSRSVAAWSGRIAKKLGLSSSAIGFTERCALLHDIGKLCTPHSILTKRSGAL